MPIKSLGQLIPGVLSNHVGDLEQERPARSVQHSTVGRSISFRMSESGPLQGSGLIQQVTGVLRKLSTLQPAGGFPACFEAASVLLSTLSQQGVDTVGLYSHTNDVCMLAGAAGTGSSILQEQQMVMSGNSWGPSQCCLRKSPFLYKTVHTAEDMQSLPADWSALYQRAGLRTFIAAQVTVAITNSSSNSSSGSIDEQSSIAGVLLLGSRQPAAFMDDSWGLLLSMVSTGLVPLLSSPWLAGLASLAASLVDVSSMDDFAEFAGDFLQRAGKLLQRTSHMQIGARLALFSSDAQELLLLYPTEGVAIQSSSALLVLGDCQNDQDNLGLFSSAYSDSSSSPQVTTTRIAAANTLLARAVENKQQCFVADVQTCLDKLASAPADMTVADDNAVGSMVAVPLFAADGQHPIAGLYLTHGKAGDYLKDSAVGKELANVLQSVLQQEWAMLPCLDEVHAQFTTSCLIKTAASNVLSSHSGAMNVSSYSCAPARSSELGVLQKVLRMQEQQAACASGYLQELQLHSVLGEGGFSTVYGGTWHGSKVAVKVMRVCQEDALGNSWKGAMEMATLSTLRHPNIVSSYACLTDIVERAQLPSNLQPSSAASSRRSSMSSNSSSSMHHQQSILDVQFRRATPADLADANCDTFNVLVMEHCDRGNLSDAVCEEGLIHQRCADGRLRVSMGLLYTVLLDIAAALKYMHSLGLVHLDVKASNILLQTATGRPYGLPLAKLGDLGLTKLVGDKGYITNRTTSGTLTHLAPERLQSGSMLTAAADVYGFGILMYELYTASEPYAGLPVGIGLMKAVYQGLRPQFPDSTPASYRALAEACWRQDISARPPMDIVLQMLQEQYEPCLLAQRVIQNWERNRRQCC